MTLQPGTRRMTNSAATVAFGFPTSAGRNKNCLLRLEMSIVSMSMQCTLANPSSAKLARISHPSPPHPITRILHSSLRKRWFCLAWSRRVRSAQVSKSGARQQRTTPGENESGSVNGPPRLRTLSTCCQREVLAVAIACSLLVDARTTAATTSGASEIDSATVGAQRWQAEAVAASRPHPRRWSSRGCTRRRTCERRACTARPRSSISHRARRLPRLSISGARAARSSGSSGPKRMEQEASQRGNEGSAPVSSSHAVLLERSQADELASPSRARR